MRIKKAFTLIELLVVISIIALLMSIMLPALSSARSQARRVICMSNMKQMNTALLTYDADIGRIPRDGRIQDPNDPWRELKPIGTERGFWDYSLLPYMGLGHQDPYEKFRGNDGGTILRYTTPRQAIPKSMNVFICPESTTVPGYFIPRLYDWVPTPVYNTRTYRYNIGFYGGGFGEPRGREAPPLSKISRHSETIVFIDSHFGFFNTHNGWALRSQGRGMRNSGDIARTHGDGTVVGFFDGHAEFLRNTPKELYTPQWMLPQPYRY